jgi:Putative beta-barrel porin 2
VIKNIAGRLPIRAIIVVGFFAAFATIAPIAAAQPQPSASPSPSGSGSPTPSATEAPAGAPELVPVEPEVLPALEPTPPEPANPNIEPGGLESEPGWRGELGEPRQENAVAETNEGAVPSKSLGPRINLGPFRIQPLIQVTSMYDDNILISHVDREGDFLSIIAPGFSIGIGDYLEKKLTFFRLDYTPIFVLFADHTEFNSIDQYLRIEGQYANERIAINPYFEYDKLSSTDRDAGGRVDRELFTAGINSTYVISDKTSINVNGVGWVRQYQHGTDSKEVFNNDWFNYNITPKFDIDVGLGLGLLEPEDSGDQTYEQALVRVRFFSTAKLTLNANAGVEFRQFASGTADRATPVFGLGAIYKPSETTTIRLSGARQVYSSISATGLNYTSTRIDLDIEQQIWHQFLVRLAAGYEHDQYDAAAADVNASRVDNYISVRPEIIYRFRDWMQFTLFYQYQKNDSNLAVNSFVDNQVGLQSTLKF